MQNVLNVSPEYSRSLKDLFLADPLLSKFLKIYQDLNGHLPPADWYDEQVRLLGLRVVRVDGKLVLVRGGHRDLRYLRLRGRRPVDRMAE